MNNKMKICGYQKLRVNDDGLLEMSEISIKTSPDNLRKIAQFLSQCADSIEKHGKNFGHEHLSDQFDKWNNNFSDIIVTR